MPAVTRELSITYGGFTVGGATDYLIKDKIRIEKGYASANVSFNVIVSDASGAPEFATLCSAIEAAFRKPWQACTIALDGSTLESFSHTDNTNRADSQVRSLLGILLRDGATLLSQALILRSLAMMLRLSIRHPSIRIVPPS